MSADRELAERAVRAGAERALAVAGGELDVQAKSGSGDLVSAADHASEAAIVALLGAERPDDARFVRLVLSDPARRASRRRRRRRRRASS